MLYNTLPEANIGPENRPLERKFLLETTIFEAMLVLGSVYHATCQPCHPANPAPELSLNSSIISLPVFLVPVKSQQCYPPALASHANDLWRHRSELWLKELAFQHIYVNICFVGTKGDTPTI